MSTDATPFAAVVDTSAEVAATSSRRAKIAALAALLQRVPVDRAGHVSAYLSGILPHGPLGVGWRTLAQLPPPAPQPSLTLADVDRLFTALAATAGPGSGARRAALVTELFGTATAAEQQFLARLIGGELRQGASAAVMVQAVAMASGVGEGVVRRAAMLAGSVIAIAEPAIRGGAEALEAIGLRVGTPVLPMLAASAPDLVTALGDPAAERMVERKLDGIRIQAHKQGAEVRLFTRSLDDITARLPEVVQVVAGLACDQTVLDGEVLALRTPWFFDLLHLDGVDLLDEPYARRRATLETVAGEDLLVPGVLTADPQVAHAYFDATIAAGYEGVVVKDPASAYAAGRRGSAWIKVKPVHTLDLVVLAVEWGSGRRRGWLSNIHLGARDPAGGYVMVGKTFKGMTDEILRWQTERFTELAVDRGDWVVTVRPEQVVEIAVDSVHASTRYPGGVGLRFARVLRYRDDKSAAEADTLETVRALGR